MLQGLARPAAARVRWTTAAQWHVTLRFFGELADDEALAVADVLSVVCAELAPATCELGPGAMRLGRNVLCVPVAGLEEAATVVRRNTAAWGLPDDGRPFQGHLTLARSVGRSAMRSPMALGLDPDVSAQWTASSVSLVASTHGSGGTRYQDVGSWPLGGVAA